MVYIAIQQNNSPVESIRDSLRPVSNFRLLMAMGDVILGGKFTNWSVLPQIAVVSIAL